jgi:hypothetical protein
MWPASQFHRPPPLLAPVELYCSLVTNIIMGELLDDCLTLIIKNLLL